MIHVKYPEPNFKIKIENGKKYIFDAFRKLWLLLTEEEWVRQNFVQYLTVELKYPSSFIALEREIILNDLKKRFDVLIYGKDHKPFMLIECKAAEVPLSSSVLEQVLRYNISVPVEFIIITNGTSTMGWKKEDNELKIITEMPRWNSYSQ